MSAMAVRVVDTRRISKVGPAVDFGSDIWVIIGDAGVEDGDVDISTFGYTPCIRCVDCGLCPLATKVGVIGGGVELDYKVWFGDFDK